MANSLLGDRETLAQRASLLRLTARSVAHSMQSGNFKSLYRGQGIEFNGVREYLQGDDVRAIDWNVTARMAKTYVKQFDEDRELQVFIVADRSASMMTGTGSRPRIVTAMESASLLTLAAFQINSPVGAAVFDGEITFSAVPKAGRNQTFFLLSKFSELPEDTKRGTALAGALAGAGRILKRRSMVIVISDFRVAGWQNSFAQLAMHHDVIAVRITDPTDAELPENGSVPFIDCESGERQVIPTESVAFRREWRDANSERIEQWQDECIRHGGSALLLSTEDDAALILARFFARSGRR